MRQLIITDTKEIGLEPHGSNIISATRPIALALPRGVITLAHIERSKSLNVRFMKGRVFTGDTLLINGTGRTDFQNGSSFDAYDSLFNKLLKLPEKTLVYPAHDYNGKKFSTIETERNNNL